MVRWSNPGTSWDAATNTAMFFWWENQHGTIYDCSWVSISLWCFSMIFRLKLTWEMWFKVHTFYSLKRVSSLSRRIVLPLCRALYEPYIAVTPNCNLQQFILRAHNLFMPSKHTVLLPTSQVHFSFQGRFLLNGPMYMWGCEGCYNLLTVSCKSMISPRGSLHYI